LRGKEIMDSRKIMQLLKKDGWELKRTAGSHRHFVHPTKKGLVTVPHPKRDLPPGTLKSIEKQANIKLGEMS
jgi:predicted RNA binding protein YcfA (HicA-like mRNA interferase family)